MAGTGWETASRPRHAELVSASMAEPLTLRCAEGNGRPWTLKQVQGDDEREAASGRFPTFLTPDEEWRFHRRSSRDPRRRAGLRALERSEEHTSELQSLMRISYAVFCLKKNKTTKQSATDKEKL